MKKTYKVGDIVTGCVTGIEKYGIFVSLDDYYSGLIHISEISDSYVRNIDDYVKIGDTIRVKILDVNKADFHIKLSIKNFNYRIFNRNRRLIHETEHGFETLKSSLEVWMKTKQEELLAEKNKKI